MSCEALGDPISTHAFGTGTQWPVLPILEHTAFVGTGLWKVRERKITGAIALADPRADAWVRGQCNHMGSHVGPQYKEGRPILRV